MPKILISFDYMCQDSSGCTLRVEEPNITYNLPATRQIFTHFSNVINSTQTTISTITLTNTSSTGQLVLNNVNIINLSDVQIPDYIKSYLQISNSQSYITFQDICDDTLQFTSVDGIQRSGTEWVLYFLSNKYFKFNNTPTYSQLLIPANGIVIFRHDVYFKQNTTYDIYYWIKRNGYPVTNLVDFIHDSNQNKINVTKTLIVTTEDGWELYKVTFTPTSDIDGAYVIVRDNEYGWYYNDIFVTGFTIIERNTSTQLPLYSTPSQVYNDDSYVEYTIDIQPDDILMLNFTQYNTGSGTKGLLTVTDNTNKLEIYINDNTFMVNTNNVGTVTLNSTDVYTLKIDFQTKQIQLINNTSETTILTYTHNVSFNHNNPLRVRIGDGVTVKSTTTTQIFTDLIVLS